MNILRRLALKRKKLKVNEIPKEYLAYKSQNTELEKKLNSVNFYYLDNGSKLLSVIKNSDNNSLEVLNILNSLDSIFHINFDNLFIRKSDEKLLGFTYPLVNNKENPRIDLNKLIDIIKDSNDSKELCNYLCNKDEYAKYEAKSILINTIFWYKILKYLNSKKISVRNLSYEDMIEYNETYSSKYIYIMNVISKLDILDEEKSREFSEEIEVVNLCVNYFLNASQKNVYSGKFNKFVKSFLENYELYINFKPCDKSFFENMNFLEIFYEQFENIIKFNCGHEFDKSFMRCKICNLGDEVLKQNEYNTIFNDSNFIFNDQSFSVYSHLNDIYMLINESELTEHKIDCIKKIY